MRTGRWGGFRAAVLLLACFGIAQAHASDSPEKCRLTRVASLDAITENGQLLIAVKLDGRDSWLRVDMGSPFSMISKNLVGEWRYT